MTSRNPIRAAERRMPAIAALAALCAMASPTLALDTDCDGDEVDGGGYNCTVSASTGMIPDLSASPTANAINTKKWKPKRGNGPRGDDSYFDVPLAGSRTFDWYGTSHAVVYIGSNGYVSFGAGYTDEVSGASVPDAAVPNNAIYAYGDDLTNDALGTVYYEQTTCLVDRDGVGGNDACFVVRWDGIPHAAGAAILTVTVSLALDLDTGEVFVEIESETGTDAATHPRLVGTENASGTDGLWFKLADPDSRAADDGTNAQFVFGAPDVTPPQDVAKLTAAATESNVDAEWSPSVSPDAAGVLVLRKTGAPVDAAPVDGTAYPVGMTLGAGNLVVCDNPAGNESCADGTVTAGTTYHYKAFAYDDALNYAPGVDVTGVPLPSATFKWSFKTSASALAPVGAEAGSYLVGAGNDGLVHRMAEADGSRGGWDPPDTGTAVQARPMVGDLAYPSSGDPTAYVSGQDGTLYRYGLDDGALDGMADVVGDANCIGSLQAGPVVHLDAIDDNNNSNDDRVLVSTRCGVGNKTLLYSHDLSTLHDSYDAGGFLGMSNATPKILYIPSQDSRVYVPHRVIGNGPSVVVHQIEQSGLASPPWSVVGGIGDVDVTPELIQRGSPLSVLMAVGNTSGELHLFDAMSRVAGAGTPLVALDSFETSDGPVKGLLAAPTFDAGVLAAPKTWLVWTTDGLVHGILIGPADTFDATTYWSIAVPAPSAPLVLKFTSSSRDFRAYVGSSDGQLYEIDATDGTILRTWLIEAGKTVGVPTFDYNDGVNQGVVVGTSGGLIVWVVL